jgi:hypothetical protein
MGLDGRLHGGNLPVFVCTEGLTVSNMAAVCFTPQDMLLLQ